MLKTWNGIAAPCGRAAYLRRAVEESRRGSLRLGVGELHGELKAQRQVARHEEPAHTQSAVHHGVALDIGEVFLFLFFFLQIFLKKHLTEEGIQSGSKKGEKFVNKVEAFKLHSRHFDFTLILFCKISSTLFLKFQLIHKLET